MPRRDVSSRYVTLPVTYNGGYFRYAAKMRGTKYATGVNRLLRSIQETHRRRKRQVQEPLQQEEPRAKGYQQRLERAKAKLRQVEGLLKQKPAQRAEEPPKKKQMK